MVGHWRRCALWLAVPMVLASVAGCSSGSGVANLDEGGRVATVAFSPGACSFADTLQLVLSCSTPGATIRYTTDGSVPTESSQAYTGPIILTQTTGIRAIAFKDGMEPGTPAAAIFTRATTDPAFTISPPAVAAELVQSKACELSVTCTVETTAAVIKSVVADLSQVGGSPVEPLVLYSDHWGWSGTVTPPSEGSCIITVKVTDGAGLSSVAQVTLTVAPANKPPSLLGSPAIVGRLIENRPSALAITCLPHDPDGQIWSVTADLSPVGGSKQTPLFRDMDQWVGYATITPPQTGDIPISIKTVDDDGAADVVSSVVTVEATPKPPKVSTFAIDGSLVVGKASAVAVSCTVVETGSVVTAVAADLSQIGGRPDQPLTASGDTWRWSGTVTPTSSGPMTVNFQATNDIQMNGALAAPVQVEDVPRPTISDFHISGALIWAEACAITVSCLAEPIAGEVRTVTADLSKIGGPASQSLTLDQGRWTWSGVVTPEYAGSRTITLHATDDGDTTGTAFAMVNVTTSHPGAIAGTWKGNVKYPMVWAGFLKVAPTTVSITKTFSDDALPDSCTLFFMDPKVMELPAATLVEVGATGMFSLTAPKPALSPAIVAPTVRAIERTSTSFRVDMDLWITTKGHSPVQGTYSWQVTLGADDQLVWSETTHYTMGFGVDITATGVLTRQ